MVYEEAEHQEQQRKVFYNLWERNKSNKEQIKEFARRVESVPNINKVLLERA